jgi:hypothetical protein
MQKGRNQNFGGVNHDDCRIVYDFENNVFYSFKYDSDDKKLEAFNITNFQKGAMSSGFAKEFLSKRLGEIRSATYGFD